MFLLFAVGAMVALCALLWRVAIYALPVFVGFSAGWWTLNHGAGMGAIIVGIVCAVGCYGVGRYAATVNSPIVRNSAICLFAVPAAYTGFVIVWQILGASELSAIWRCGFAFSAGVAAGGTTIVNLCAPVDAA